VPEAYGSREPRYEGYILDLDGTVYIGDTLIPGAREAVEWLRASGRPVVFLSNKPLEPASHYAAKLSSLGIPAMADDVLNSTQALLAYAQQHYPNAAYYCVGEELLLRELCDAGLHLTDDVDKIEVVIAAFDRTLTYAKLNTAYQALVRGAKFFATNGDRSCPIDGGTIPDCAGVIAFLEATAEGQVEMVAGKPSRQMLSAATGRLGVDPSKCLMVGDRLATDMRMGQDAGIDTALVLTGVTSREHVALCDARPTYVLESLRDLP